MCAPAGGALGDTCLSRHDCASGMCGKSGGAVEGMCTMSCSDDTACGAGWACVATRQGAGACWPRDGAGRAGLPVEGLTSTGCHAGGGVGPGVPPLSLLVIFALVLRRRG
jgi:hypothetical protein